MGISGSLIPTQPTPPTQPGGPKKKAKPPKVTCGATTRSGVPCKRTASKGRNRCKLHGGASPSMGPNHPAFKHGKYSRALPTEKAQAWIDMLERDDLMTMVNEIALLDIEIEASVRRLKSGAATPHTEIRSRISQIKSLATNPAAQTQKIAELLDILDRESDYNIELAGLTRLIEQRGKAVNIERQRLVDAQAFVTLDQFLTALFAISRSIRSHVQDKLVVEKIITDIRQYSGIERVG